MVCDMRGTCIRNMELQFAPFDLLDPHLVIHVLDLLTGADVAVQISTELLRLRWQVALS